MWKIQSSKTNKRHISVNPAITYQHVSAVIAISLHSSYIKVLLFVTYSIIQDIISSEM